MKLERQIEYRKEHLTETPPVVALEGVGGSGKSHIGGLVVDSLREQDIQIIEEKVAGLGDSKRVLRLRKINECREKSIDDGTATRKVLEDKKKDKIFRLATQHQVRLFLRKLSSSKADVAIIDRTPLMSWVYAASADPENPYLDEILRDGIKTTRKIGLSKIYFLQVSPEVAYSRLIARACVGSLEPQKEARELCALIGVEGQTEKKIVSNAISLIDDNPSLMPKSYRRWDFIPFEVMRREDENYTRILEKVRREEGIDFVTVNAERPVESVKSTVVEDLIKNPQITSITLNS